jgi:protein-arginine kinase
VLVNYEDHIEIVILPEHKDTLKEGLSRLIKLLQTFEKLGYATDPYLGNLTVSPRYLGTAMEIEAELQFEHKVDGIGRDVSDEINYSKHIHIHDRQ